MPLDSGQRHSAPAKPTFASRLSFSGLPAREPLTSLCRVSADVCVSSPSQELLRILGRLLYQARLQPTGVQELPGASSHQACGQGGALAVGFLVQGPSPLSVRGCSEMGWGDGYRLAPSLLSCPDLPDMSEPTPCPSSSPWSRGGHQEGVWQCGLCHSGAPPYPGGLSMGAVDLGPLWVLGVTL